MKELIQSAKDFKIIPGNFKSSGMLDIISVEDEILKARLILVDEKELEDYGVNTPVEVFGVNNVGLIYFESKILDRDGVNITLALTQDYSIIQRREYSRVCLNQGSIVFKDMAPDFIQSVEDISAGGAKLLSSIPLEIDKHYEIEIHLSNNMKIECMLSPIRVKETTFQDKKAYIISGKFINLENADRIILVQYAFRIKMEEQSKEND